MATNKNEKKEGKLEVLLPESDFPRTMFANRFSVETHDDFKLVHFALVTSVGILIDDYCVALTNDVLESNKVSLLDYLGRVGVPEVTPQPWPGGFQPKESAVADIINMTFQGGVAETQFVLYSRMLAYRTGVERRAEGKPINVVLKGQAIALVRSNTILQQQLIKVLYE